MDFVVKTAFRVRRARVLSLLSLALTEHSRYRIVGSVGPHGFDAVVSPLQALEGALNDSVLLIAKAGSPETHCLDRVDISRGLEYFAERYPAHFADFMNDKENGFTARLFLECCQEQD